MHKRAANKVYE